MAQTQSTETAAPSRSGSSFPTDWLLVFLLELVGYLLCALTVYVLGRWYAPLTPAVTTLFSAILLVGVFRVLVRIPVSETVAAAIEMLRMTLLICFTALLFGGIAYWLSTFVH